MIIGLIGRGGFASEVEAYLRHEHPYADIVNFEYDTIQDAEFCDKVLIAIGEPQVRERIANHYPLLPYTNFKSNNAIGYSFEWGIGAIICPAAILTTNVRIGHHVHINLGATIGHDTMIGDYTTIAPGAHISGNVTIGRGCYIGSGVVIREKVSICDNVIIGAGAVVVKDITESGTYTGVPCKILSQP